MMMLKISNISVSYGVIKALKNINIDVKEGSVTAILGANGAGKSTLLKTISGLIESESGTINLNDLNLNGLAAEKITQKGIIHVPEGRHVFKELSVYDNLKIGAFTLPKKDFQETLNDVYTLFPILKERKDQQASLLSGGEQQMLAIGRGLMARPKLLILDEPSLGLAPLIVKTIFTTLKRLNDEGMTILIVEQNALQTLKIADYAYVLQVGKIIQEGNSQTLLNDPKLIEAYLGKA
jgi:branched-chain amino acid transport system ATP-binding protein